MSNQYITRSDLVQCFGEANILVWSDMDSLYDQSLPPTDPANIAARIPMDARVDYCISRACDETDDRFRQSVYLVPFQPANGTLNYFFGLAAQLAGVQLYESRGLRDAGGNKDRMSAIYDKVMEDFNAYLSGERHLAAARRPIGGVEVPRVAGGIRFAYSVARGEGSQPWGPGGAGSADGQRIGPNQGSWQ